MARNWVPRPSSDAVTRRMRATPRRNTVPERKLRIALDAFGLRYQADVAPLTSLRRKADLVFPDERVAVFVDGCFWHGCPVHGEIPRANEEWWRQKIERNRLRDLETNHTLEQAGWMVIRVWEHSDMEEAALKIIDVLHSRNQV